jgi:hypothetical protein
VTTSAIAAVTLRSRNTVRGEIVSVKAYQRPWMRTDVVLGDGTGTLLLRFLGRATVPGLAVGRRVIAQGTPGLVRNAVVIVNPLYSFVTAE